MTRQRRQAPKFLGEFCSDVASQLRPLRFERLEPRQLLAGDLTLVKDVNVQTLTPTPPDYDYAVSTNFTTQPVAFGGAVFFAGEGGLWRTSSSSDVAVRIKDGLSVSRLAVVGDTLFFVGTNGTNGAELWKSDGTTAGTVLVKDIYTGTSAGAPNSSSPYELTNVDGTLYFTARDGSGVVSSDRDLWKSDGTAAGTVLVKEIVAGSGQSSVISGLTNFAGSLVFSAHTVAQGHELWTSDGTASGTTILKDIFLGPGDGLGGVVATPVAIGGTLYFAANDGASGQSLWKTNGTDAGTMLVKDIVPGPGSFPLFGLTRVGGRLFFTTSNGSTGTELWKSDGTDATTVLVKDILPGPVTSLVSNLVNVNGTLYFSANDGTNDAALWKSDGTEAGTVIVRDLIAGSYIAAPGPAGLINASGVLYFTGFDGRGFGDAGRELWKSDGSTAGTVLVKDIRPGISDGIHSDPLQTARTNVGTTVYFVANDGASGPHLWKSDGTAAGTKMIVAAPTTLSANPNHLIEVNGSLFFAANDGLSGIELWRSDGTALGTSRVKDISTGAASSAPLELFNVGGTLYFAAHTPGTGFELWKSDGTDGGTAIVKDINLGPSYSYPGNLTNVGGTLFFTANDGSGYELWKSNGTSGSTTRVKDIRLGSLSSSPQNLTVVGNTLYFTANDGSSGDELWKSDGTSGGTVRVSDIRTGPSSSNPQHLVNVNGTLFFAANDGATGTELWKSNGSAADTVLVKNIYLPFLGTEFSSGPEHLINLDGTLYFAATEIVGGRELWKSNGTAAGTVPVDDITGSRFDASPRYLTNVGGTLFFVANDGLGGAGGGELWKFDPADAEAVRVKDIRPGDDSSSPDWLANVGGVLFFQANDGVHGVEAWTSDGTTAGTMMIEDLNFGAAAGNPRQFTLVGDKVFAAATAAEFGRELFVAPAPSAATFGDFSADGFVDGGDVLLWQRALGSVDVSPQLDADGNGIVDAVELQRWRDNFGLTLASATASATAAAAGGALQSAALRTAAPSNAAMRPAEVDAVFALADAADSRGLSRSFRPLRRARVAIS